MLGMETSLQNHQQRDCSPKTTLVEESAATTTHHATSVSFAAIHAAAIHTAAHISSLVRNGRQYRRRNNYRW
jgi:hypothetical protein